MRSLKDFKAELFAKPLLAAGIALPMWLVSAAMAFVASNQVASFFAVWLGLMSIAGAVGAAILTVIAVIEALDSL